MNGYELSRNWFDWCFINPDLIKPNHTALYSFSIEHCNRLGWKEKFGLPTTMAMEAIGIKSYNTYKKTLDDLVDWEFIIMIERSKNQYSANIVALSNYDKATDKALDKALIKHSTKQSESTIQSIDSIIKQLTIEQLTTKQETSIIELCKTFNKDNHPNQISNKFNFKESMLSLPVEKELLSDWLEVRKKKKAVNSKTAFETIRKQIELSPVNANECVRIAAGNSWVGIKAEYIINYLSNEKNRRNNGFVQAETKQQAAERGILERFENLGKSSGAN